MATETTATLSNSVKTHYDRVLLVRNIAVNIHNQFGQVGRIAVRGGKTIEFRRYNSLTPATTALTEGVAPAGSNLSVTLVSATIEKLGEKGLDSKDYFIVRDPGSMRNAISLGVFSTREAAQFRLSSLQDKGVSNAELGLRDKVSVSDFVLFDSSDAMQEELGRLSGQIRLSEVIKRDCPAQ